jgi:hypothetical protein
MSRLTSRLSGVTYVLDPDTLISTTAPRAGPHPTADDAAAAVVAAVPWPVFPTAANRGSVYGEGAMGNGSQSPTEP